MRPLDTDTAIVRRLVQADGQPTPGPRIAEALGCSRVSVHNRIEALCAEGFGITAAPRRGYQLTALPQAVHPAAIGALLAEAGCAVNLIFRDTMDSTQAEASRQLAAGAGAPLVAVARAQTAGRGRLGRAWHSEDGRNLYLSMGWRPLIPALGMARFTLVLGLAIADALEAGWGVRPMIKWPNDLLLDGRKVAGMLAEARLDADATREVILGLGLNVGAPLEAFPEDLRALATSLAEQCPLPPNPNRVACAVIAAMDAAAARFFNGGDTDALMAGWPQRDALTGRPVTVATPQGPVAGVADGIAADGALCLRRDDGRLECFHAGDVSVRPQ